MIAILIIVGWILTGIATFDYIGKTLGFDEWGEFFAFLTASLGAWPVMFPLVYCHTHDFDFERFIPERYKKEEEWR